MRRRHRQDAPSAVIDVCFAMLRYSGAEERAGMMMGGRLKICVSIDNPSDSTLDSTLIAHDRSFESFDTAVIDNGIVIVRRRQIDSLRLSEICYVNKVQVVYVVFENEETEGGNPA
jgi:hypothetical protein